MKLRLVLFITLSFFCKTTFSQRLTIMESEEAEKYPAFNFDIVRDFSSSITKNDTLLPIQKGQFYRYINSHTKKVLSKGAYEEAYPFRFNYAIVKENGKYGIINRQFDYTVKPTYLSVYDIAIGEYILPDNPDNDPHKLKIFSFEKGKFYTGYDKAGAEGEVARPPFYFSRVGKKFQMNLRLAAEFEPSPSLIFDTVYSENFIGAIVGKSRKIGRLDAKGKTVIPFQYTDISIYNGNNGYGFGSQHFALKKKIDLVLFPKREAAFS